MHFLTPLFVAFGVLGALPVIIHLVGRSRAKVRRLPTLLLLYASQQQVSQRTRLRHWLLLLFRVLVMLAIPLCLAKPYVETASDLPAQVSAAQSAVVVLDDSLSMRYQTSGGPLGAETLFSQAKKRAARLFEALGPNAEAALVLGSRGNAAPVPELTGDRARLFSALSALQPSYRATDLGGALKRAAQILQTVRRPQRRIYLVTDGAAHALDASVTAPPDTEVSVLDVAGDRPLPNHAVVDVRSDAAPSLGTRAVRVTAEVANFGDQPLRELPITLVADGKSVAKGLMDVPARGRAVKRFYHILQGRPEQSGETPGPSPPQKPEPEAAGLPQGLHHLSVALEPDALRDDDERHLKVELQRHLRVLILDGDPRVPRRDDEAFYLETALRPGDREDAPFELTLSTLDDTSVPALDYDAVFVINAKAQDLSRKQLDKALREYVQGGGGLFIAVGDNVDVDAYNGTLAELLPQPLAVVKTAGPVRRDVAAEGEPLGGQAESALSGSGERLGRMDRRHPLLIPFASQRASESLLEARFGRYLLLQPTPRSASEGGVVLSFESGAPALVERQIGRGRVLLLTSTLDRDWNSLPIQPAYLPLVQQAVRYLARAPLREGEQATLIGQPRDIRLQAGDTRVEVTLPSGKKRLFERLVGRQVLTYTDTIEPGLYRVAAASETGAWRPRPAEAFIVNVDPSESDLARAAPSRIEALERPLAKTDADAPAGAAGEAPRHRVELWHGLGLVLLFLLIGEALLLRRK